MRDGVETLLILDFGSQYTQLIARRAREMGVFSIIVPFKIAAADVKKYDPLGIVLSGGPDSVYAPNSPQVDPDIFNLGVPVLGICYGLQLMTKTLGGVVETSPTREYGKASLELLADSLLLEKSHNSSAIWMSHGDHVATVPPEFSITAKSGAIICAIEHTKKRLFGLQFHPEVAHTEYGNIVLSNFLRACGFTGDWSADKIIDQQIAHIRNTVGDAKVVCALSGGVDSSVAATLVDQAIGRQQTCIFVDTGLLRQNEYEEVLEAYKQIGLNVVPVRAAKHFLTKLKGVSDPERKRKIIGAEFIRIFDGEAKKIAGTKFLVQGTLYPDVIESVSVNGPSVTIKSHHNVGGLPKKMKLKLIEPLRELFKDEVRLIGKELGLPDTITRRQPFPGPGLAIRIIDAVSPSSVELLQKADAIVREEIDQHEMRPDVWQFFAVLLPIKSVGVMGDGRTYEQVVAIRAVSSVDGMTADWSRLPHDLLARMSARIISEVRGVNRVVYDITSKPPGTIEWE